MNRPHPWYHPPRLRRSWGNVAGAFRASGTTTPHRNTAFAQFRGYFANDTDLYYGVVMAQEVTAIRLAPEVRARIAAVAPGRPRSDVMREALDTWLSEQERKHPSRENP